MGSAKKREPLTAKKLTRRREARFTAPGQEGKFFLPEDSQSLFVISNVFKMMKTQGVDYTSRQIALEIAIQAGRPQPGTACNAIIDMNLRGLVSMLRLVSLDRDLPDAVYEVGQTFLNNIIVQLAVVTHALEKVISEVESQARQHLADPEALLELCTPSKTKTPRRRFSKKEDDFRQTKESSPKDRKSAGKRPKRA